MVKASFKKVDGIITELRIKGHAMYDKSGKDIVCSSISSMLIVSVNAILKFDKDSIEYNENNEFYLKNIKRDEITNKLIENLVEHLRELELKYKKNIQVKEE